MKIETAAKNLDAGLRGLKWYITTGIDDTPNDSRLFVYVTNKSLAAQRVKDTYEGFPVTIKKTGWPVTGAK